MKKQIEKAWKEFLKLKEKKIDDMPFIPGVFWFEILKDMDFVFKAGYLAGQKAKLKELHPITHEIEEEKG